MREDINNTENICRDGTERTELINQCRGWVRERERVGEIEENNGNNERGREIEREKQRVQFCQSK